MVIIVYWRDITLLLEGYIFGQDPIPSDCHRVTLPFHYAKENIIHLRAARWMVL